MNVGAIHMIAAYIDQIIMFFAGIWACGIGYGYLPPLGKDPSAQQQWFARFGKMFRIIGPTLVVIALVLAGARYFGVMG